MPLDVCWVPIKTPDPTLLNVQDTRSTFNQGWEADGAKFFRLEGCWEDHSTIYFVSTGGGDVKNGDLTAGFREGFGQVWAYRPGSHGRGDGTLTLVYESPSGAALDSPDNLTVTPRGGLMMCEDDASGVHRDQHPLAPPRARQPRDRAHARRRGVRVRREPPQQLGAGGRLLQPERPDDVLQPLRAIDHRPGREPSPA